MAEFMTLMWPWWDRFYRMVHPRVPLDHYERPRRLNS